MSAAPNRVSGCSTRPVPMRSRSWTRAASANGSRAATPRTIATSSSTRKKKRRRGLQAEWLADYAREIDNLRAALDWAFSPGGDGSIGVALTAAAGPLWMRLSLIEECRSRTKQALGALGTGGTRDPREEMKLHAALGASTSSESEMGAAYTNALAIAESLGDIRVPAARARGLYYFHAASSRFRAALPFAQKFHDLAAKVGRTLALSFSANT